MSNSYTPTNWVANKTVATADVMNNMEEGILNAHQKVDVLDSQIKDIAFSLDEKLNSEIDDTQRFKRLLEKIRYTGGEIVLPAGEYSLSETINLPSYTKIKCNGDVIIKNNGNFDVLLNVGYGCIIEGITLKVDNSFTGVVCSLNSQHIYASMNNIQNHNYSNCRIGLNDLLIVCGNENHNATAIEIFSNGSTTPFESEGGLYCIYFNNINITGYFKTGINIKRDESISNTWVHNLFFDNINFKQCETDIKIDNCGYCSFFNNIISQPVRGYSKKFLSLNNTNDIIFNNIQYWDIHLVDDKKIVDINNTTKVKFNNASFGQENLNITNVKEDKLYTIELNNIFYPFMDNSNLHFTRCCSIGRSTPYYDKIFYVKIPKGGKASVNFDITGSCDDGISEKVYANYTLAFSESNNKINLLDSNINIIDSTAKFDKEFYIDTQSSDSKYVYGYVYAKTKLQNSPYNTIFIKNRNHQMYDSSFLKSNTYGNIIPLEQQKESAIPTSATIIDFPETNITNLYIKKETRVVNLTSGQNNLNDFISTTDYDIKMADVTIKNAVLWNTTDTIINYEKSNQGYRVNLKVFSNKDIENVTIEVTALVSKK